ncbi:NifB/NifX family molybdenum-iron cluster-binding protein [Magnetococcales bacterium HHB-1]
MKIAITSQNRKTVTGHPGRCRRFWIYDSQKPLDQRQWLEIDKEAVFHQHPEEAAHPLDAIDVLISAKMAFWLEHRLKAKKIKALATSETDPNQAVTHYLAGTLKIIPTQEHHPSGVKLETLEEQKKKFQALPNIKVISSS